MSDITSFVVSVEWDPFRVHILPLAAPPDQARAAVLTIGGSFMPSSLSIDDTTGTAKVVWVDAKGDTDAAAPANAKVTFAVDDETVATIDADTGALTPVKEGSANVTVEITDATTGGPLMEPDGTTPFEAQSAAFSVVAGAAAGVELQITA